MPRISKRKQTLYQAIKANKQAKFSQIACNYAERIVSGEKIGCRLLIAACQRFLDDLERTDLTYDVAAVEDFCLFFETLSPPEENKHVKIQHKMKVMDWQAWIAANLYGFRYLDGRRRFIEAFLFIPRRNGKSALAAVMTWWSIIGSQDIHTKSSTTSKNERQSRIVLEHMWKMALNTRINGRTLKEIYNIDYRTDGHTKKITSIVKKEREGKIYESTGEVLALIAGQGADGAEGYAFDDATFDEVHSYKQENMHGLIQVVRNSMTEKPDALLKMITTAGDISNSVGYKQYRNSVDVVLGGNTKDRMFACHYAADPELDWDSVETWEMANPAWGVNVDKQSFQRMIDSFPIEDRRHAINDFKTKRLNLWVEGTSAWLDPALIDQSVADFDDQVFIDNDCFIGFDMSAISDLTSYCITTRVDNVYYSKWYNWITQHEMKNKDNKAIYEKWNNSHEINISKGNQINHEIIMSSLAATLDKYGVRACIYDKMYSEMLMQTLAKKYPSVKFHQMNQTSKVYTPLMNEFEGIFFDNRWKYQPSGPGTFCMKNVAIKEYAQGTNQYKMPNKLNGKNNNKIDAAVAMLMSLAPYFNEDFKHIPKRPMFY